MMDAIKHRQIPSQLISCVLTIVLMIELHSEYNLRSNLPNKKKIAIDWNIA